MKRIVVTTLLCVFCVTSSGCGGPGSDISNVKKSKEHYTMGVNHFNAKAVPQAIRELMTAVTLDPENYQALHLIGFIYMGRKQYPEAVRYFRKALEIKPDYHICVNNLGVAYLYMERWEEAATLYEELVQATLYTSPWLAYANLGWAYYQMGRTTEAIDQTKMALFLNPEMCLAQNNLGIMYSELMEIEDALNAFTEAIQQCDGYAEPHLHMGKLLAELGEAPRAARHFRKCVELSSKSSLGERCRQYARTRW